MELGIADLFTTDAMQRLPGIVTRELEASGNRRMALEALRLQDEIKFVGDERAVMAEIGQLVSSSQDIGQVYDRVIDQVRQLIPLETAAIAVADITEDSVTLEYVSGDEIPGYSQGQVMPMSGFTMAGTLARFVLVLDTELLTQMRSEFPGIENLLEAGVRSLMATPLIHRDEVVGFLATATSTENAYGPEHVEAAERIGSQISGALASLKLHASISQMADVSEILAQLSRDASAARDLQALYASVFGNLKKLLPVDRCAIALISEDGKSLVIDHVDGLDIEGLRTGDAVTLDESSNAVLAESYITTADSAPGETPLDLAGGNLAETGLPSSIRTPLRARNSVIGAIAVSARSERAYTARDLSVVERVSDQVSPVIDSLRLLERVQGLEAIVESTADLQERRPVQVERRDYVSTVSHELKTPLTSMKVYTDMLGEEAAGELTDKQRRLLVNLKSTVDRLSRMVDDLNVVSLLEAGGFNLHTEIFDIDDLVVSAIEMSGPALADRGISAQMVHPDVPTMVDADRERTLQVLLNLLNNAAKYARSDTEAVVTVLVTGSEVKVKIADKGPGIAEDELQAVFDSFYRSKRARISRIPGSGLGLSIARGLIEAQGG
ncbi:MAG: GAF domain-containing protein, partial [Dehalococcoidia bacterium]|nr:GAF domain-containing protein [Dehalococcoidia bacterium]